MTEPRSEHAPPYEPVDKWKDGRSWTTDPPTNDVSAGTRETSTTPSGGRACSPPPNRSGRARATGSRPNAQRDSAVDTFGSMGGADV